MLVLGRSYLNKVQTRSCSHEDLTLPPSSLLVAIHVQEHPRSGPALCVPGPRNPTIPLTVKPLSVITNNARSIHPWPNSWSTSASDSGP